MRWMMVMMMATAAVVLGLPSGRGAFYLTGPFESRVATHEGPIVLARELEIHTVQGARVAEAQVDQVLKGKPHSRVFYLAEGIWMCDSSTAMEGQGVLLFLDERPRSLDARFPTTMPDGEIIRRIAWEGSGRLQILECWPEGLVVEIRDSLLAHVTVRDEPYVNGPHRYVGVAEVLSIISEVLVQPAAYALCEPPDLERRREIRKAREAALRKSLAPESR